MAMIMSMKTRKMGVGLILIAKSALKDTKNEGETTKGVA